MAATAEELRQTLVSKRLKLSTSFNAQNQHTGAPPAPSAPPATVSGLGAALQPAGLAQTPTPAPGAAALAASATPSTPAPVAPTTIQNTVRTPQGAWTGTGPDPRDATYWANIAKLNSGANIGETNLDLEAVQRQGAHDTAADSLKHTENLNLQSARTNNARSGLGYSTQGAQVVGEVEDQWARANAANDTELINWQQAAVISRQAIEQGYTVEAAAELAEAAWRRAQQDALLTPPAAVDTSPKVPGGPSANPIYGPSTHPGAGPPASGMWWNGVRWQKAPRSAGGPPTRTAWWNGVRWVT